MTQKQCKISQNKSSLTKYPTKEEILENLYTPTNTELLVIQEWKQAYYKAWAAKTEKEKHDSLEVLLNSLINALKAPPITYVKDEYGWRYYPEKKIIVGHIKNPSIISALHELGHHLYGSSELFACIYSVGIFKESFPSAYKNLEFKGHMLTKKAQ
jgi:hypothetical protein